VTFVKPGELRVRGESEKAFQVGAGVLKVEGNRVSILCREIAEK
jgi:F0F1-type ATP synthase epsilon subunit